MLGSKNHLFVDRRVYSYKGTWRDKNSDLDRVIYYFIEQPMTLVAEWDNGREKFAPQLTINVFGEFPICNHDKITLQNGEKMQVENITLNYLESNIAVRDMLKQRIQSMSIILR